MEDRKAGQGQHGRGSLQNPSRPLSAMQVSPCFGMGLAPALRKSKPKTRRKKVVIVQIVYGWASLEQHHPPRLMPSILSNQAEEACLMLVYLDTLTVCQFVLALNVLLDDMYKHWQVESAYGQLYMYFYV